MGAHTGEEPFEQAQSALTERIIETLGGSGDRPSSDTEIWQASVLMPW